MKKPPWTLLGKLEQHKANISAAQMLETRKLIAKTIQQRDGLSLALKNYAVKSDSNLPIALLKNHLAFRGKLMSAINDMSNNLDSLELRLAHERKTWLAQQAKSDGFSKLVETQNREALRKNEKAEQSRLDELSQQERQEN
jgi:flagellar export protein FliJ